MKQEKEQKPITEEVVDPKPPVVHSSRMENRICHKKERR